MTKEYAPGIPSKETIHEIPHIESPRPWEFGIHEHHANVRGLHFDLRLGDPDTGHAHSWAMEAKWPKPGENMWVVQQPTHTVKYMDFKGKIPEGYGAGTVKLKVRGKAEVTNAKPGHISFNVYKSKGPEEYTLHQIRGNFWKLYNKTATRKTFPELPDYKPKYKEKDIEHIDVNDEGHLISAKIDDAHNLFVFPKTGEKVRVVSYREAKKNEGGLIEHTHKVPGIEGILRTPAELSNTVVRGGLYAISPKTGKATPAEIIAGMLNSDVWKSREKQKENGNLRSVLYDVVSYKGKNMETAPYAEKLSVLKKIQSVFPKVFHLPPMAQSPEEKTKLLNLVKTKALSETEEGVVSWPLYESSPAIKSKIRKDHDVYIRELFEGTGKYQGNGVGGFRYSHTPDGPIVGAVGTGLSDEQRRDMFKNPKKYQGMVAVVQSMKKMEGGALFQPSFQGFHLDKNDQTKLDQVKLAALRWLQP